MLLGRLVPWQSMVNHSWLQTVICQLLKDETLVGTQNWKKTHNLYLLLSCSTDIRFLSIFFLFLMSVRNKNTSAACKTKRRIDRRLVSRPVKMLMTASEKQRCEPEINNMSHLWTHRSFTTPLISIFRWLAHLNPVFSLPARSYQRSLTISSSVFW